MATDYEFIGVEPHIRRGKRKNYSQRKTKKENQEKKNKLHTYDKELL
jgi:hypothetical protein